MTLCPCSSGLDYQACCAPFLCGTARPKTPEALMRSRYTAYSMADIAYIKKTMRGKALKGFNAQEARLWAQSVEWLGLTVISAPEGANTVEFKACYREQGHIKYIHEISRFQYAYGHWFYTGGTHSGSS